MVATIAATGKTGGLYWPYIVSASLRTRNGIQHFPLPAVARSRRR
jgi:hypothetical protein